MRAATALVCVGVLTILLGDRALAQSSPVLGTGYEYQLTVDQHTQITGKSARDEPPFIARVRTRGPVVRVDFLPGTRGTNTPGDWYLTRDLGRTMTIVNVRNQRYHEQSIVAARERLISDKGLSATVVDLDIKVQPLIDCGDIEGWRTLCVTVYRRYTAQTHYWVMSTKAVVVETTRLWLAPALKDLQTPFGSFFNTRTELLVRSDSTYIAREREAGAVMQAGGLLRMYVERTETSGQTQTRTRRRIDVSRVRRVQSDDRLFEVPPGFRLVRQ